MNYIYDSNTKSYYKEVKSDFADRIEVEIGDSKDNTKVHPQVKIKRWDNEVNVSFRLVDDEVKSLKTEDGKIKLSGKKKEVHLYDLPPTKQLEEGGFEFEVILKEKPVSNVLEFSVETKGLNFIYQPEIIDKQAQRYADKRGLSLEVARRVIRPENVVGSYAVYIQDEKINYIGGKEYKSGKVGHIYRPQIEDADGNKVWGELNIDNNILTVTIPQDFLDNAVYPVRHAAGLLFGYNTVGGSQDYIDPNWMQGVEYTSPADTSTGDSISFYCQKYGASDDIKGVLYDSSGNVETNGVGAAVAVSASFDWSVSAFGTSPTISSSTVYGICVVGNDYTDYKYDLVAIKELWDGTNSYTSPQSISMTDQGNIKYSLYCTYTATATTSSSSSSTSSTSSSTSSTSSSSTSTSTTISPTSGGLAFGEESPTEGETASSWVLWSDGAGGSPTISGDADWGKLQLNLNAEGRSKVYGFGNETSRTFTLTENRYGTGQETASLEIRGQAGVFAQDDGEPPNWEAYSTPVAKTWKYIQVREIND